MFTLDHQKEATLKNNMSGSSRYTLYLVSDINLKLITHHLHLVLTFHRLIKIVEK